MASSDKPDPALGRDLGDRRPLGRDPLVLPRVGDQHQPQRGEPAGLGLGLVVVQVPGQVLQVGRTARRLGVALPADRGRERRRGERPVERGELVVGGLGQHADDRRVLGVLAELTGEPARGDAAQLRRPPDHRQRSGQVQGQRLAGVDERLAGRAALVGHILQAAGGQFVDVGLDPGHAEPLRDHQQRDGQAPQHRSRQSGRDDADERGAGLLGDAMQRGTLGAHARQAAAAPGGLGRDGQRLGGGARAGHRDHHVGGPYPAGQPPAPRGDHLDRAVAPDQGVEHLGRDARAAQPGRDDRPRPGVRGEGRQVGFLARPQRGADLGRRRRHLPQHVAGIRRLDDVGSVEPVSGQDEFRPAPVVQALAHACSPGRRASSTSRTGISSRTG